MLFECTFAPTISNDAKSGPKPVTARSRVDSHPDQYDAAGSSALSKLSQISDAGEGQGERSPLAVERDITARKLAERKEANLTNGFKLLFMGNHHPMWELDAQTRAFLEGNQAAVDQFGYAGPTLP